MVLRLVKNKGDGFLFPLSRTKEMIGFLRNGEDRIPHLNQITVFGQFLMRLLHLRTNNTICLETCLETFREQLDILELLLEHGADTNTFAPQAILQQNTPVLYSMLQSNASKDRLFGDML